VSLDVSYGQIGGVCIRLSAVACGVKKTASFRKEAVSVNEHMNNNLKNLKLIIYEKNLRTLLAFKCAKIVPKVRGKMDGSLLQGNHHSAHLNINK